MLNAIMLSGLMLSVIMLNVIMLNVVAPFLTGYLHWQSPFAKMSLLAAVGEVLLKGKAQHG
jgi:hypothetical protein